jgi:hypothetical protein
MASTQLPFPHIGILHHPQKPLSLELAQQIGEYLARVGVEPR